jgi:hypothetical protein
MGFILHLVKPVLANDLRAMVADLEPQSEAEGRFEVMADVRREDPGTRHPKTA